MLQELSLTLILSTITGIPIFLTFDSGISLDSINGSHKDIFSSQLSFVWGASPQDFVQRRDAYKDVSNGKALLSYYMPYSRAPSASLGFDLNFWLDNYPEFVLYKCDKKTVAFWDGQSAPHGSVPLDFTNPAVIDWQVRNQSVTAKTLGYDAMAFDNFGGGARQMVNSGEACGVFEKNGTWSSRFAGDGRVVDPLFGAASLSWIEQTSALMKQVTPGLGIIPNFAIYNGVSSFAWNSSEAKRVATSSSGILSERGFTGWGGGNSRIAIDEVINELSWMHYLGEEDKGYYSINEMEANDDNNATHDWILACFLCGINGPGGLWMGGIQAYGSWSNKLEYKLEVGEPLDYYSVLKNGMFIRNFSSGVVVLNPMTANNGTVSLANHKYMDPRGLPFQGAEIFLGPQSGVVLSFSDYS